MGGCLTRRLGLGGSTNVTPGPFGALVHKSTGDQTIGTTPTALNWDTETYDSGAWHDSASNSSRMTVPSGVSLVRIVSNVKLATGEPQLEHSKNGATFAGMGKGDAQDTGGNYVNISSSPLSVTPGDYFETLFSVASGTDTPNNAESTWFAIEALSSTLKYALVTHSSSQSLSAATAKTLSFDTETADTSAFHDTVTNNSRLTVPSGVTLVRLSANVSTASVAFQALISISKNGASAAGLPARDVDTTGAENLNVVSAPVVVTAGDYFELTAFTDNATTIPTGNSLWFAIEEVPSTYSRALVSKSVDQAFVGASVAIVTWDSEVYDTASMHDNVTNNSRLTVPSGCTRARPTFNIHTSSADLEMGARVTKNGSPYYGRPEFHTDTNGTDSLSGFGAWVDVVAGDYFEVEFFDASGCSVTADNTTWFSLECQ